MKKTFLRGAPCLTLSAPLTELSTLTPLYGVRVRESGEESTVERVLAAPRRPVKGRRAQRYRPTAKLARSRLAGELERGLLPTLRQSPWS